MSGMSGWVRRLHRWVALAFAVSVACNFGVLWLGEGQPPAWVTYAPLLPLAVLLLSGAWLFVLPHATRTRSSAS